VRKDVIDLMKITMVFDALIEGWNLFWVPKNQYYASIGVALGDGVWPVRR